MLSDRERRVLERIEQELRRSDPDLVRKFARMRTRRASGRRPAGVRSSWCSGPSVAGREWCLAGRPSSTRRRGSRRAGGRHRRSESRSSAAYLTAPARASGLRVRAVGLPSRPMLVARMAPFTSTIFAEMSALAVRTGAINLGQGFPDTDGPASLLADVAANVTGGRQPVPAGARRRLAAHGRRGAPEALLRPRRRPRPRADHHRGDGGDRVGGAGTVRPGRRGRHLPALLRLVRRDDRAVRRHAAGRPAAAADLRLRPGRAARRVLAPHPASCWSTPRTTRPARVLDREQLTYIGAARGRVRRGGRHRRGLRAHDSTTGVEHVPMATLPGLAERTLTISSAGKTFSVTGWKVGWVHGPIALVNAVRAVKQFLTYVSGRAVPAGARHRARPARLVLRRPRRQPSPASGTCSSRVCAPPGSPSSRRAARTSS